MWYTVIILLMTGPGVLGLPYKEHLSPLFQKQYDRQHKIQVTALKTIS